MNLHKEMWSITNILDRIRTKYDSESFVENLKFQVEQLSFFYDYLVQKQGGNPSKTFYRPKKRPKEHQVAYFNLTRGFPKELYDVHWCYIFKDFGCKLLIVPTTSVKEDSKPCNPLFEMDIQIKEFANGKISRLHIDDIRVVDLQRLIDDKGIYDIETQKKDINEFFIKSLNLVDIVLK